MVSIRPYGVKFFGVVLGVFCFVSAGCGCGNGAEIGLNSAFHAGIAWSSALLLIGLVDLGRRTPVCTLPQAVPVQGIADDEPLDGLRPPWKMKTGPGA